MNLETSECITRQYVTSIPITATVIKAVEQMAEAQGVKSMKILGQNKVRILPANWVAGVDYNSDINDEEEYDSDYDSDEEEYADEDDDEATREQIRQEKSMIYWLKNSNQYNPTQMATTVIINPLKLRRSTKKKKHQKQKRMNKVWIHQERSMNQTMNHPNQTTTNLIQI